MFAFVLALVLALALASNCAAFDRIACMHASTKANITTCFTCAHAMAPLPCTDAARAHLAPVTCAHADDLAREVVMRKATNNCRICAFVQEKLGFEKSACAPFCALDECTLPKFGNDVSDRAPACYAALRYYCSLL